MAWCTAQVRTSTSTLSSKELPYFLMLVQHSNQLMKKYQCVTFVMHSLYDIKTIKTDCNQEIKLIPSLRLRSYYFAFLCFILLYFITFCLFCLFYLCYLVLLSCCLFATTLLTLPLLTSHLPTSLPLISSPLLT